MSDVRDIELQIPLANGNSLDRERNNQNESRERNDRTCYDGIRQYSCQCVERNVKTIMGAFMGLLVLTGKKFGLDSVLKITKLLFQMTLNLKAKITEKPKQKSYKIVLTKQATKNWLEIYLRCKNQQEHRTFLVHNNIIT